MFRRVLLRVAAPVVGVSLATLPAAPASAAVGDPLWGKAWAIGGVQVSVDNAGRLFAAGTTTRAVDFGGGLLTPVGPSVFLASFESNGTHRWSRLIAPTTGMGAFVTAVASGPSGDVYLACQLQSGSINLGGGALSGNSNILLAKYDVDGNHQWSFACGPGTVNDLDATDTHVAVAALNYGTVNFRGGPLGAAGNADVIVAVLTSAGGHLWSDSFGDTAGQAAHDVGLLPTGELVVAASVAGSVDFGGGALLGDVGRDLALARFDAAGAHQWSVLYSGAFGGSATDTGMDVTAGGEIALTGEFSGTVDFGGGALTSVGVDIFAARFAASGAHLWSARYGGAGSDRGGAVSIDAAGNLGLSGLVGGAVDFGGGSLNYAGLGDAFVASFDAAGAHRFSRALATTGDESRSGHVVDGEGAIVSFGNGGAPIDLGGGPLATGATFAFWMARYAGDAASTAAPRAGGIPAAQPALRLSAAPNPFDAGTSIRWSSGDAGRSPAALEEPTALAGVAAGEAIELAVFDVRGRRVRTLVDAARLGQATADGTVDWDGRDTHGSQVPAGVYFVRAVSAGAVASARLVVLR